MNKDSIANVYHSVFTSLTKLNQSADDLNAMIAEDPKKALKSIFFPTFFTLFCLSLNGLVDSIFVSECGASSLIGVGVIQSIFVILVGIGSGISVATNSSLSYVISKYASADRAQKIIDNTIILTLIIGILSSVILLVFLKPILIAMNINDALDPALIYGTILFSGNVFFFYGCVLPSILKAEGEIIKSTNALISTCLLNVVLDYIFIHVLGYGVYGAGFATTFCSALCCILLFYFMNQSKNINLNILKVFSDVDFSIMKNLFVDSIPVTFECMVLSLFSFLANMLFNNFTSPTDFAAFVAAYKVYSFAIIPIVALSEANVTIVAYLYGKNSFQKMNELLSYEIKKGILVSFIIWIVIFIFRDFISYIYLLSSTESAIATFSFALVILNILLIIMPLGLISVSLLQGIQSYKESFVVSSIRSILLEILLGFIFAYLIGGAYGIYVGFLLGGIIGCVFSYIITNRVLD